MAKPVLKVPQVSPAELADFAQSHFSDHAVASFGKDFVHIPPQGLDGLGDAEQYQGEEVYDDDGLGYYSDGVKRTLTDEQIEIFRHSELEALRRQEEKDALKEDADRQQQPSEGASPDELGSPVVSSSASGNAPAVQVGSKRKRPASNRSRAEPKPDLRKRTWDVVEAGLDTLDYD